MFLNSSLKFKSLVVLIFVVVIIALFIFFQSLFSLKKYSNKMIEKSIEIAQLEKEKEIKNYVTLAYKTVESYHSKTSKNKIKEEAKSYIDEQLKYLFSIVQGVYEHDKDNLSEEELKRKIILIIENARYGKSGYFWINNFDYKMIMHPINKKLSDKYYINTPKVPFVELAVDKLKETNKEEVYIEYPYYNPYSKKDVFKSSIVKVFKPYNWVIGTGVYIDDYSEIIKNNALKTISQMSYDKNGYFWIVNSKHELLMHYDKLSFLDKNYFEEINKKASYLYKDIVKIANEKKEGGFLKYFWTKPNQEGSFEKLSFMKKFEPWDFIIGTGVYVDEIEQSSIVLEQNRDEIFYYVVQITILFVMMMFLIVILLINIRKQKNTENQLRDKTKDLDYLNKNLEEKILSRTYEIETQKQVLQKIIDTEVNMMVVTDFNDVPFMNQSFLSFFNIKNQRQFINRFPNFIDIFCEFEDYIHKGKINNSIKRDSLGEEFYNLLKNTSEEKRVVLLLDPSLEAKSFYINMTLLDKEKNLFLVSLTDITKLTIEKLSTEKKAYVDSLTNAPNRNSFNKEFEKELQRAERYKTPLSLALLDIDYFKKVNDTYGHDIGDEILVMIANECQNKIRKTDFFARWGGEEFVIMFPQTILKNAAEKSDTIRLHIESLEHKIVGKITCSIGVTNYLPEDDMKSLFKRCDEALYKAKANGRNRIEIN